jgi:hypothetical protein
MKSFKEITHENLTEGGDRYPADEMTMKELKIACYAAQNILERLEDGAMIQRWQISAIVKASDELASVYTSMSTDEGMEDDDDEEDEYEDEMGYDEYGYPSMYGEETDLVEESEINENLGQGLKAFRKNSHLGRNKDPRLVKMKLMLSGPDFIKFVANQFENKKPTIGDKIFEKIMKVFSLPREGDFQRRIAKKLISSGEYKKAVTVPFNVTAYTDDEIRDMYNKNFKDVSEETDLVEASEKVEIPKSRYETILKAHGSASSTSGTVTRSPKGTMKYKGARHLDFDKATNSGITQTYSHGDHGIAAVEVHTNRDTNKKTYYMYKPSVKEELELDEVFAKDYSGMLGSFKKAIERAEQAKAKGYTDKMEMQLDRARNYLFGMKTSDTAKLKNSDHYDRYKKLKGLKEESELDEDARLISIHNDYISYKNMTTADLLKRHKSSKRVSGPYTAAEVGGKQGLISDLLNDRHGNKSVKAYFAMKPAEIRKLTEDMDYAVEIEGLKEETELEEQTEPKVSVGQKVRLMQRSPTTAPDKDRGLHAVTKVMKNYFEIDKEDYDTKKPMKIKHNGYAMDYKKSQSGRIKNLSRFSGHFVTLENGKSLTEDMDYAVEIEGLPKMYVKGKSPMDVRAILRKVIKKPDLIQNVERTTKAQLRKAFMLKAQGKDDLEETYLAEADDFRKKVIGDAIKKYADGQKEIRGVAVDKIIDAFASKKTYGNKTFDELEDELGMPIGPIMKIAAAVKENLKNNYNVKATGGSSQAQRIDRYLKQKHVGPIKR